ncbi:hypothetical protein PRIPAC_76760 [Pristionchus pacificus]|uniref:Uncharacterized protein n=1 Tax=Pristionchus pacificus TaxID=54126 RepID=A0A2A6BID9_PRIPA|nr:hypothetical protein PRIPAC_76760 [Pristionchus pacificus]|eukprot:PDM65561.1 hypothetical protein PRIPAC_52503 [Pristionchus pacificus]
MFVNISNLSLNAIAAVCCYLPERSTLELRQLCKSTNVKVCSILSVRETVVTDFHFSSSAEEQHIRLIFHRREHFFTWALCLLYVLKQLRVDSERFLNLETNNNIVYLKLTSEELPRILQYLKRFTTLSKFPLLRTTDNIQPEIINAYTEFIKGKCIKAVFLHQFDLTPSNHLSWLKLLSEIRTGFVHIDVESIANKQSIDFLQEVAQLIKEITIIVGSSCNLSASSNLSLARQILSRKCDSLALRNKSFRISPSQAENMLQFVHRLEKKVIFNTYADDSFGKRGICRFGTYIFRLSAEMASIRHVDYK